MPQNPNFKQLISNVEKSVVQQAMRAPNKIASFYNALPTSAKQQVIALGIKEMQTKK